MSSRSNDNAAALVLADGTIFPGRAVGASGIATGEVVFTTGMTGYQEVLTDPSYAGQIVTMTAPQIGNTGLNRADDEADRPRLAGFVLRESSPLVSNYRSEEDLQTFLTRHNVVGIDGIDTRALTRHIRDHGAQNGAIGPLTSSSVDELRAHAQATPSMLGLDLATSVSTPNTYEFFEGSGTFRVGEAKLPPRPYHVVAVDFGLKRNILRCLVDVGCRVTVVPSRTTADQILGLSPDGVFLSNGPGDPAALGYAVTMVQGILGRKPLFGICLGHQLLGLALGATTSKLRFGHRGINQPVRDETTGRIEVTTQNHGFVVDVNSLDSAVTATHQHLNDGTNEGIAHREIPAFSVQYHPEAAAGPHDSLYLFERFTSMIESAR